MSEPIIQIKNLSKIYRIGAKEEAYKTFREAIMDGIISPIRNLKSLEKLTVFHEIENRIPEEDTIWALKDVSFHVQPGEVVGIIGRNGAGKTTLLKILSRITEPSEGTVDLNGKLSSLLEVGTGFHPELTGRENIFLNGAILGMRKKEIEKKFDEIVDFSGIEKFIDTPVKRYSSGMYVRLAFSIAAHLEPEILLVDEVLAVGDVEFQKKCLGKMGEVSGEGRTVLFVSHNMAAVSNLCVRCALLDSGKLIFMGNVQECVQTYLASSETPLPSTSVQVQQLPDDRHFRLHSASVFQKGCSGSTFLSHLPIQVAIKYEALEPTEGLRVGFNLYAQDGTHVFEACDDDDPSEAWIVRRSGKYLSVASIPGNFLQPGRYKVSIDAGIHMKHWIVKDRVYLSFFVEQVGGVNAHYANKYSRPGVIMPLLKWEVTPLLHERCAK